MTHHYKRTNERPGLLIHLLDGRYSARPRQFKGRLKSSLIQHHDLPLRRPYSSFRISLRSATCTRMNRWLRMARYSMSSSKTSAQDVDSRPQRDHFARARKMVQHDAPGSIVENRVLVGRGYCVPQRIAAGLVMDGGWDL
jgi:hypothetical protein